MEKYGNKEGIRFVGGIYDFEKLNSVRYYSFAYFHGHSVGGTNPSLLEAMASSCYILANDNIFNRAVLKKNAEYYKDSEGVKEILNHIERDPMKYYTGRSPLEAASIGIDIKSTDVSLRTNLVTLSEDDLPYEEKTIEDYCADDISTEEAEILIKFIDEKLGTDEFKFYPGVSYRHCLIWDNGTIDLGKMTPPHDITGKVITEHLSTAANAQPLIELMKKSYDLLKDHPVNIARKAAGKRPSGKTSGHACQI